MSTDKVMYEIRLTEQQLKKLLDVLWAYDDEGPRGEGWKSQDLCELIALCQGELEI